MAKSRLKGDTARAGMTNYGLCTRASRLRRVMALYSLTLPKAEIWLDGWNRGRRAALEAYKRHGVRQGRARVGGPTWEAEQADV